MLTHSHRSSRFQLNLGEKKKRREGRKRKEESKVKGEGKVKAGVRREGMGKRKGRGKGRGGKGASADFRRFTAVPICWI